MNEFEKQMMGRATEIMKVQPDLEEQSKIREKHKFQEEDLFWEGANLLSEDDIERRPCTEEEKSELDKSLEKLGDLFHGADFYWQLDGALNISLYRGEYIGVHKDIDLSIDFRELEKVESFLGSKGFGLFLSSGHRPDKKRIFERIDAKGLQNNKGGFQPMIFAINEDGSIKYGEEGFGIDTHIIKWNESGKPIGHHETTIPKEWLTPETIDFHGRKINCSNPALATYHKLFFIRAYDDNDLKLLAQSGKLTLKDVDLVEQTFNKIIEDIQKVIKDYVGRVLPKIKIAKGRQEISDILINDEITSKHKENEETEKFCNELAEKIITNRNMTAENMYDEIFATTPIIKLLPKKEERFAILRDNISKN
jgi:hypothetical protein